MNFVRSMFAVGAGQACTFGYAEQVSNERFVCTDLIKVGEILYHVLLYGPVNTLLTGMDLFSLDIGRVILISPAVSHLFMKSGLMGATLTLNLTHLDLLPAEPTDTLDRCLQCVRVHG